MNNKTKPNYENNVILFNKISKKLTLKIKTNKIFQLSFLIIIFLINFSILIISFIVLGKIISLFNHLKIKNLSFTSGVLPTLLIAFFSILIFIISFLILIIQDITKMDIYKKNYLKIQYEFIKYKQHKNNNAVDEQKIINKIETIYYETIKIKKRIDFKKIFFTQLTKELNEKK